MLFHSLIKKTKKYFSMGCCSSRPSSQEFVFLPHQDHEKWPFVLKTLEKFAFSPCSPQDFTNSFKDLHGLSTQHSIENLLTIFVSNNIGPFFFQKTLPTLAKIALEIPETFEKNPPKILSQGVSDKNELTKKQVACLVSHMFFGTIGNNQEMNPKLPRTGNLTHLISTPNPVNVQKLLCLFSYFEALTENQVDLSLKVVYERVVQQKEAEEISLEKKWLKSQNKLGNVEIADFGGIEDNLNGEVQVDFANKFIGGGTLRNGTVQEEILFSINPETLPSMLMFESFNDNEVGVLKGCQRFANYQGYKDSFQFSGKVRPGNRADNIILALDATHFSRNDNQFLRKHLTREINKAFLGFSHFKVGKTIATGKWGCGVFNGDPELKFLIQWMAAAESKQKMKFYPKNDSKLAQNLDNILRKLDGEPIGKVMKLITEFDSNKRLDLFEFLLKYYRR